jgi:hypothetical protein
MYVWMDVTVYWFLTSTLDCGEWRASRSGRLTPGMKNPGYPVNGRLGGTHSRPGRFGEQTFLVPAGKWRQTGSPLSTPNELFRKIKIVHSKLLWKPVNIQLAKKFLPVYVTQARNQGLSCLCVCWTLIHSLVVDLPDMNCFLCCVVCVLYCSVTLYYSVLLFFFYVVYCLWFLYCTVSACDVRAATLTEVFPCFFLSCKTNARV